MGCGSSRSAVAVVETQEGTTTKSNLIKKSSSSLDHFTAQTCKVDANSNNVIVKKSSISSLGSRNLRGSNKSLKNESNEREKSAASIKSKDSGVFDDRQSAAGSQLSNNSESVTSNPQSATRSSARKKLLRIDDIVTDNKEEENNINIISRPVTRFGNLAFDLVLDTPETGNLKKRPAKLAQLENKKKRKSKKTKEEIEKKMREVEERRKIQEAEKQIKAKQFQHLGIHTTVQPFSPVTDDEEET
ncbi:uncharacterized protein LOC130655187 [Hydractinia symbiolongicarpus]|uniref:uncharacterized protein LOC130655187 n=1 Tax=Hydractinia symbiolongicarpus TaxID=13093 RepID=UPI00254E3548|nr:uncharacterized protein LOC130655187 [Hydractinia symbiolongicarpus]